MDVRLPDGTIIQNVPEGTTKAQLVEKLQRNGHAVPGEWLSAAAPQEQPQDAPPVHDSIGRQAGLFVRSALNGIAGIPQIVTEPIRNMVVNPALQALGLSQRAAPLTGSADQLSDAIGLPAPRNAQERIVGKGVEMGMGGAGFGAGSGLLSKLASPGVTRNVLQQLGSNLGTQAVAGTTGGMAGQQAKEGGGGAVEQFASTVLGGLAGAGLTSAAKSAGTAATRLLARDAAPQLVDQRITQILVNQGIDPRSINPALLSSMRRDVGRAMQLGGQLDDAAVARLADYSRIGATPTRAGVTLDPYDVTMQRNAEKLAAATGSRAARLPEISNTNNARLLSTLEGLGPSADAYGAGAQAIGSVTARNAAMEAEKKALYDQARGMAGGDIPLDRSQFMNAAFEALARENKTAFLPENIGNMLNQISLGKITSNGQTFDVPFNVNTLDNLKTMLATASRSSGDGNTRAALASVRKALESVPISPTKPVAGGGAMVTPEMAQLMRGADAAPDALMGALNQARSAAARQFAWQESAPGIERALAGAAPDNFVQANVLSKSAGYDDVARLAQVLSPEAQGAVRGSIAQHLMDAATGKGRAAGASNFSGIGLQRALGDIGDRKLGLFFSPEEIEGLKSAARVGQFETFQPRGSAVNNSNTAAATGRLLQGMLPRLKVIPGVNAVVGPAIDSTAIWSAERPALNVIPGLLGELPQKAPFATGLLGPAAFAGGLLSAP